MTAARITAATEVIEQEVGVALGSAWQETSRYDSETGDSVAISDTIRSEARGFVRARTTDSYAEQIETCDGRMVWRAWAAVAIDRDELRTGLRASLTARGPRGWNTCDTDQRLAGC
ncbi:MAG: hypothetical protein ACI9WU_003996 [Myxococcota bacterium]|jgi:hypothetical protein